MSASSAKQDNKVTGYISVLLSEKPEGSRIRPKWVLKRDFTGLHCDKGKFPYHEFDVVLEFYDMFAQEFGKVFPPHRRGLRGGDWLMMNSFTQVASGKIIHSIQYGFIGRWQNNIVLGPHCDVVCHSSSHTNALFFLKGVDEREIRADET